MSVSEVKNTKQILIVDDDPSFLKIFEDYMSERYPDLEIIACPDPLKSLPLINSDIALLLLDLEMPGIDGGKILSYATEKGLSKNRIIILSAHDADYLHKRFPMGECLAVLNKHEARQKDVLDMVINSLQKKD